ncbi:MAG: ABC transporter substrate-binding protein [Xanthobacteraceae bacterium]
MVERTPWSVALALASIFAATAAIPSPAVAAPIQLTISYSQKVPDYLALLIANDTGLFKKHGLDVSVRYLPAQEGIPGLVSGQVQMAGIGGSDAASAEAAGTKLKLVLTFSPVYTFQFWARPQYATAGTLKGQRVGITSTTGSLYAGTLLALKQLGLKRSDVVLTPLGAVTNINSSLLAGSIAAAASHPPATYLFKKAGFVDLVDLPAKKIPSVSDGLWVSQSYIEAHPDVVQGVVDAIVEAYQREKSDRDFAEGEMTKNFGVKDKAQLDFTYDFYIGEVLAGGVMPEVVQIQSNIDALAASNPKVKSLDAAAMIDQRFVKNAQKRQP